jgi:hypothetical protein
LDRGVCHGIVGFGGDGKRANGLDAAANLESALGNAGGGIEEGERAAASGRVPARRHGRIGKGESYPPTVVAGQQRILDCTSGARAIDGRYPSLGPASPEPACELGDFLPSA